MIMYGLKLGMSTDFTAIRKLGKPVSLPLSPSPVAVGLPLSRSCDSKSEPMRLEQS